MTAKDRAILAAVYGPHWRAYFKYDESTPREVSKREVISRLVGSSTIRCSYCRSVDSFNANHECRNCGATE